MLIRKMTIDDYDEMFALWLSCKNVGLYDLDDSREGIGRYLVRNPDTSFVAVEGERIVGTIMAGHDGRRGLIYHVAVAADYRHRGIARELASRALKALEAEGITKTALMVYKENEEGNLLWERLGFGIRGDIFYRDRVLREMKQINR